MFYFYAMPFVVSDDGIQYTPIEKTTLEGKEYEGFKVSYNDGVGISSKDEYIVYYDAETKRMEWLAYTVTYFSGEKSQKFSIINYQDWAEVNGLLLPAEMQSYKFDFETKEIGEKRYYSAYRNAKLVDTAPEASVFEMPEGAKKVGE